ncbi:MAG TPA: AAA family ATPase [Deltaproteobacteria bacterium]|nr:AAA family ATPase [Deltaproteobacteria bacterium]
MFDDVMACPRCGMVSGRTDRFCRYCGGSLDQKGSIREYRHITALFSDLCDYTPLTEELEPEELKDILNTLFKKAIQIVSSYGGTVEKFVGDGIIALFGLDTLHEQDAIRAIHAAQEIHRFADELADTVSCVTRRRILMHTGINTGLVLVDQQSDIPFSHGVLGTPMNIASRISDLAGPDEILIGDSLKAEAARYFILEDMGRKNIKGIKEPMGVFKILSKRAVPVAVRRNSGITSGMVGREKELGIIMAALETKTQRGCSAVCISGAPGVGKSRLIQEFKTQVPSMFRLINAQCLDHTKDTPYYPIASLVRELLGVSENGSGDMEFITKIEAYLSDLSHISSIRALCGLVSSRNQLMPDVRRSLLSDAVSSLFHAAGEMQPLVLCIEDIHWADQSTLDLLEYLVLHECQTCSCLFVFSTREEIRFTSRDVHIRLKDLSLQEVGTMARHMLDIDHIPEATLAYLFRETGGNPFYVEEMVNYLMEKGVSLSHETGEKLCEGIPPTIQGLVAARLENLGKNLKILLQEASIIGKIFSRALLQAISTLQKNLDIYIAGLESSGFIHMAVSGVYSFRHALTQEVAYRTLLKQDRIRMHAKVGDVLERPGLDNEEICDMLAYHFDLAGRADKAICYSIMAARKYQAEGSWVEAAAHYCLAEKWLKISSDTPDIREKLITVWEGIWSCARIFNPVQATQALESLRSYYTQVGMEEQETFALIRLINLYSQKGQFEEAIKTFEQACALAGEDTFLRSAAMTVVAYTYTYLGRPDRALAYLAQARQGLTASDSFLLAVNHLTTLSACVWKGALVDAHQWYCMTKQSGSEYMDLDLMAEIYLGYIHYLAGSFQKARQVFDRVALQERKLGSLAGGLTYLRIQSSIYFNARYTGDLVSAQQDLALFKTCGGDMKDHQALADLYRSWIELEMGRYECVRELLMKVWPRFKKGIANRVPYALNALAEALCKLGELEEAEKFARQSIEWNEENGNQDQLIWALRIMGDIYVHRKRYGEARAALKRASRMSRLCSMKPHVAWTLESWGDLFHHLEKQRPARACYDKAIAIWRDSDNSYQARRLSSKIDQ